MSQGFLRLRSVVLFALSTLSLASQAQDSPAEVPVEPTAQDLAPAPYPETVPVEAAKVEEDPAPEAEEQRGFGLDEIIVTAQ